MNSSMRAGRSAPRVFLFLLSCAALALPAYSQRELTGAVRTRLALQRLNFLGRVLLIGAHPDDENTALLAYLARGRKARAAYLSLTRGEGGQNLIGPEQGELLGLIRTQELLAARRIDGAEQFFTRAIDFGYSKTAEETLTKWNRDEILADIVWTIRSFRPDVVVLMSTGTPADGHGNHQAAGILGKEAYAAAADGSRFPEQLRWVKPWRAKRLMVRTFGSFGRGNPDDRTEPTIGVDTGEFDPLLGYSYGEIAGMSRSMHKTQGMGAPERRGPSQSSLVQLSGEPAKNDIFDGVQTSWSDLPGGAAVAEILAEAARTFRPEAPDQTVPLLLRARPLIAAIRDPRAAAKLQEIDEAVALCTGLWLDASAEKYAVVPGEQLRVDVEVINRSQAPLVLESVKLEGMTETPASEFQDAALAYNQPLRRPLTITVPAGQPYSQPPWLREPPDGSTYRMEDQKLIGLPEPPAILRARFTFHTGTEKIELVRPVIHRYVDRVEGETTRPIVVVPPVAVSFPEPVLVFPDGNPRKVEVLIRSHTGGASGEIVLEAPAGWRVDPPSLPFRIQDEDGETSLAFTVDSPPGTSLADLRAVARTGGTKVSCGIQEINYAGLPPQTVFPPAVARLVRADIRITARKIGYVMGAGDEVPAALRQLGCEITLLRPEDLAGGDLGRFDAIITGVRAYNVRSDLRASQRRLVDYVERGGTLVVQYNVPDRRSPDALQGIGPYPFQIGRDRVSVEEAPVRLLNPHHPLLAAPNKIGEEDFQGWIQERGLYFASQWDQRYEALFESHDPGEEPLQGGTLYARYGKGVYIFTAYSWFRQLPAGVPGALRIFADFLSADGSER